MSAGASLKGVIQAAGDSVALFVPKSLAGTFKPGDELSLVSHGRDALLCLRPSSVPHGYIAGELSAISMAEVFGLVVSGMRSGRLVVTADAAVRTVAFHDGQISFASSSAPHERLGRFVVDRGAVTAEELERALKQVGPGRRLGQVLVASKLLSPTGLYQALASLVKEIVLATFELEQGHFLFCDGVEPGTDALGLPEKTQAVLLQGIQRADALAALRRKFPPTRRLVALSDPPPPLRAHRDLVRLAASGASIAAMRAAFSGGEHAFYTALDSLVDARCLGDEPAPAPERPAEPALAAPSPLSRYGRAVAEICEALKAAGRDLSDLRSFFADPLPGLEQVFAGVSLADDGSLDLERVRKNAGDDEKAIEALDSFLQYALFSAKNALEPASAEKLAQAVRRIRKGGR